MIRHLVFFNLKPDLDPGDREKLFSQIQGLARIPSVTRLALGKLLDPNEEWYKPRMWTEFEWAFTMEFENEEALYAYQQDPGHVVIAQEIRKLVSNIKVMDFVTLPYPS